MDKSKKARLLTQAYFLFHSLLTKLVDEDAKQALHWPRFVKLEKATFHAAQRYNRRTMWFEETEPLDLSWRWGNLSDAQEAISAEYSR